MGSWSCGFRHPKSAPIKGVTVDGKPWTEYNRGNEALPEAVERKCRVPAAARGYGRVGNAMGTPVSDGERVCVVCGEGQVSAYDLEGHLVRAKRFAEWTGNKGGITSPLLCENVLIIKSPAGRMWRARDARTGELIREPKTDHFYAPAGLVRLYTAQGAPVNAVVYPNALQIRRAEDGRVLGEFPVTMRNPGRGFHFPAHRDLVRLAGHSWIGSKENGTTAVAGTTLLSLLSADGGHNAWWRGPRPDGGGRMGSRTPSGNRVFIPSACALRCIGDPTVEYERNAASRPEQVTKALKGGRPPCDGGRRLPALTGRQEPRGLRGAGRPAKADGAMEDRRAGRWSKEGDHSHA